MRRSRIKFHFSRTGSRRLIVCPTEGHTDAEQYAGIPCPRRNFSRQHAVRRPIRRPLPVLSRPLALFGGAQHAAPQLGAHTPISGLFYFQAFPHSLGKIPRGGGERLTKNRSLWKTLRRGTTA